MELATTLGFDVRVVTLPKGEDPADAPDGFEERLGRAESYVVYRVRLELERAPDRQEAFVRRGRCCARRRLAGAAGGAASAGRPARPAAGDAGRPGAEAWRRRTLTEDLSPRVAEWATGWSATRWPPASCSRRSSSCWPSSRRALRRRAAPPLPLAARGRRRAGGRELVALRAELDARAAREGLDERTGKELLLNLRERRLRRELAHADLDRVKELQTELARVQDAILESA